MSYINNNEWKVSCPSEDLARFLAQNSTCNRRNPQSSLHHPLCRSSEVGQGRQEETQAALALCGGGEAGGRSLRQGGRRDASGT